MFFYVCSLGFVADLLLKKYLQSLKGERKLRSIFLQA